MRVPDANLSEKNFFLSFSLSLSQLDCEIGAHSQHLRSADKIPVVVQHKRFSRFPDGETRQKVVQEEKRKIGSNNTE